MAWGDHEFRPCGECGGDAFGGIAEAGPTGPRVICKPCYKRARLAWEEQKMAERVARSKQERDA
jgi:hypothetical protein